MQLASALIQQCLTPAPKQTNSIPKAASSSAAPKRPTLTDAQRRYPLLRLAAERVKLEVDKRARRYLRRLDCIHASGSRTHQQRWDALGQIHESMLSRMDLATLAIGWVDDKGELRLNRQRTLAEDSQLSDCRVSRTLAALERAGYVSRKYTKLYEQGKGWVTRTAIRLRRQFFIDLGLGHELQKVLERKQRQRDKQLQEASGKRQQQKLSDDAEKQIRRESHARSQGKRRVEQEEQQAQTKPVTSNLARKRLEFTMALLAEHPDMTDAQIAELVNEHLPLDP